jgi:hypothetical protein
MQLQSTKLDELFQGIGEGITKIMVSPTQNETCVTDSGDFEIKNSNKLGELSIIPQ